MTLRPNKEKCKWQVEILLWAGCPRCSCIRAWRVSFAEIKKTRSSASFGLYTFNSFDKKSIARSWCCALTYTQEAHEYDFYCISLIMMCTIATTSMLSFAGMKLSTQIIIYKYYLLKVTSKIHNLVCRKINFLFPCLSIVNSCWMDSQLGA